MKKEYCSICDKYRKLKNPKMVSIFEKTYFILLFAVTVKIKVKMK